MSNATTETATECRGSIFSLASLADIDPVRESMHIDIIELAAHVDEQIWEAPPDADAAMIADFILENWEPDEHGRILNNEHYRPVIAAMATLAIMQRDVARAETETS